MSTPTIPNLPVPPAAQADGWEQDDPQPYRVLWGAVRPVEVHRASREGLRVVRVYTHAIQYGDGTICHDESHGGPGVSLDTLHADDECAKDSGIDVSPDDARRLAASLIAAADEVDGWVTR
ncbi:hypothetical protein [Mycolicibacterium sp. CR10]|uniref:hypothetical protein n=1 Tax=Mycolicibacterium sp. CR10 TaxID=2562314 RepID=UPI0010C119F1|nr:hypothetical protein [Mycolicibacterium sp. CR10]